MKEIENAINAIKSSGNLRKIPKESPESERFVDFSSNDYLGLAEDRRLRENFLDALDVDTFRPASSASRLLGARQREYDALEKFLGEVYGRPALLFNSGYHANTGIIAALGGRSTLFVADKLVHASILDGMVLSRSKFVRFRHNDYGHARRLVEAEGHDFSRIVIVAESVYSMDGDRADIDALVSLKSLHPNVMLYVDEAHAVGVCGTAGLGLCHGRSEVDIVVGTFGKALASDGAFALMSPMVREYMINRCRSLIFSTALSPLSARWSLTTLREAMSRESAREHLCDLSRRLHDGVLTVIDSHIQPLIIGDAVRTVEASRRLLDDGLKVLPIRTPTVPPGTERLRISLSAALTREDIDRLVSALAGLNHE